MKSLFRLLQIFSIMMRHTVNRRVIGRKSRILRKLSYLNPLSFANKNRSRGESIRIAFEKLGPIYVKFGQLLSTRADLIPEDIIVELEKLQDRVPPFSSELAVQKIELAFKKNIHAIYKTFDKKPLASASIAQVHSATLKTGEDVVVKIIRPKIEKIIRHDISVLKLAASLIQTFWKHGKRLRAKAVVTEFEKTIWDELDLMREAANASQLRRNFANSDMMYVPKIYWDYTRDRVMTMERIYGVQISDIKTLRKNNVDLKKLSQYGVEIFFMQVFCDAFFHADMHPGNLFVDITDPENPRYLGIDFGIMGTLSPVDQISLGTVLLKLFQTAERFNMTVQPQLILLQKTLFYIESLGRKLYPDLDLWATAKPLMVRWMRKRKLTLLRENTEKLLQLPTLMFDVLQEIKKG